jgi:hypothetical protein
LSFELVYKVLSKRLRTKAICRSEMKYQYSTISGRSSFPKDVALKMAQARRKREREREREYLHKTTTRQSLSN